MADSADVLSGAEEAAIRDRWAKASPGPWYVYEAKLHDHLLGKLDSHRWIQRSKSECIAKVNGPCVMVPNASENGEAIAHAPEDIRRLQATVAHERALREAAEGRHTLLTAEMTAGIAAAARREAIQEVRDAVPGSFWGSGSTWPDGTDPYREGGDRALECVRSILDRLAEMPDAERTTTRASTMEG